MKVTSRKLKKEPSKTAKENLIGFTLIELLVVIAVIGLLSTLAVAALNSSRQKARNAKRLTDIRQYSKAFDMAFDKNSEYPDPGSTSWYCLGDYPDNLCWSGGVGENATINGIIDDYLPGLPISEGLTCSWEGYIYRCVTRPSGVCDGIDIRWFMEGTSQSCAGEITLSNDYSGTGCTYCQMIRSF